MQTETQATLVAAYELLKTRQIIATFEYPGFISIPVADRYLVVGDVNAYFSADLQESDGNTLPNELPFQLPLNTPAGVLAGAIEALLSHVQTEVTL